MKKHSFKKSGTNFYKKRAGGGSKAIYKLYKKTDKLVRDDVPNSNWVKTDTNFKNYFSPDLLCCWLQRAGFAPKTSIHFIFEVEVLLFPVFVFSSGNVCHDKNSHMCTSTCWHTYQHFHISRNPEVIINNYVLEHSCWHFPIPAFELVSRAMWLKLSRIIRWLTSRMQMIQLQYEERHKMSLHK